MPLATSSPAQPGQPGDHGPAAARIAKHRQTQPIQWKHAIAAGTMDSRRNVPTVDWAAMPSVSTMRSALVTRKSAMECVFGLLGASMELVHPNARMASR